jgi:hypothetical protein
MAAGWSKYRLYLVSFFGALSVIGTGIVNSFVHGWKYYGEAPLQFFGGVAAMAAVPLVAGFLLYELALPATGWRQAKPRHPMPDIYQREHCCACDEDVESE